MSYVRLIRHFQNSSPGTVVCVKSIPLTCSVLKWAKKFGHIHWIHLVTLNFILKSRLLLIFFPWLFRCCCWYQINPGSKWHSLIQCHISFEFDTLIQALLSTISMGKLQVFDIRFSNPNGVFFAGQELTGQVFIELSEPMKMRSKCGESN